jgi:aminoglycoside phosphotransferase family enzyme/predicted kinase
VAKLLQGQDAGLNRIDVTQEIIDFLSNPANYPDRSRDVSFIETHISLVFLGDAFVYKVKKPLAFDFLDFSSLEARKRACEEEVRLNRRLAPDVYLGVVPIYKKAGGAMTFAPEGELVEYAVKMIRLPERMMLDKMAKQGRVNRHCVAQLTEHLRVFYTSLSPANLSPFRYLEIFESHVKDNRQTLLSLADQAGCDSVQVAFIHAAQRTYLSCQRKTFDDRVKAGKIIEGHGDLRPEHICLSSPPKIFDCIEFNAEFRTLDIADELAFLCLELEAMGHRELGDKILIAALTALEDRPPSDLLEFYKSYRACVRAKVGALALVQHAQAAKRDLVKKYLDLACDHAKRLNQPQIIVVGGLIGSGKSHLANGLAKTMSATLLQTDLIRKELFPSTNKAGFAEGKYSAENRRKVYQAILDRTKTAVRNGVPVIIDGSYTVDGEIERVRDLARELQASFTFLWCECSEETTIKRLHRRANNDPHGSEADIPTFLKQKQLFASSAQTFPRIVINSEAPPDQVLVKAFDAFA